MRETIRHDMTSRTILAYLDIHAKQVRARRLAAYMWLMHRTSTEATKVALHRLAKTRRITRVGRGVYCRRSENI